MPAASRFASLAGSRGGSRAASSGLARTASATGPPAASARRVVGSEWIWVAYVPEDGGDLGAGSCAARTPGSPHPKARRHGRRGGRAFGVAPPWTETDPPEARASPTTCPRADLGGPIVAATVALGVRRARDGRDPDRSDRAPPVRALEQPDDVPVGVDVDVLAARAGRQAGHRPHLAAAAA